jgi:hypothetical protein
MIRIVPHNLEREANSIESIISIIRKFESFFGVRVAAYDKNFEPLE